MDRTKITLESGGLVQLVSSAAHALECPFAVFHHMTLHGSTVVEPFAAASMSLASCDLDRLATAAAASSDNIVIINDACIDRRFMAEDGEAPSALPGARFLIALAVQGIGGKCHGTLYVGDTIAHAGITPAQRYVLQTLAYAISQEICKEQEAARPTLDESKPEVTDHISERLRLLESVVVNAKDAILITEAEPTDLPGPRIVYCNASFTRTTGYTEEDVIGKTPRILQNRKTDRAALDRLKDALAKWQPVEVELLNERKDGTEFWVELSIVPVCDETGWFTHWVSVQRDVSERKLAEQNARRVLIVEAEALALQAQLEERKRIEAELTYKATHDDLTGLRNRAFFMDRLRTVLDRVRAGRGTVPFVFYMDLDRFKLVNDSLGHRAGDLLLIGVASRLLKCLQQEDTLARIGGDEFVILIESADSARVATTLAAHIIKSMKTPFRVEGHDVFSMCSIGIVQVTADYHSPEEVIRDADVAMYDAKAKPNSRYQLFTGAMRDSVVDALRLQTDLQYAIARKEFALHYQLIHDVRNGGIRGIEALIRWQHPDMGLVAPGVFIPIAEDIGLIQEIGWWVLRTALIQIKAWDKKFTTAVKRLSVNVSAVELLEPDFASRLEEILADRDVPGDRLQLEITEGVFLQDATATADVLQRIRDMGIHIALDDFGTGYSSLAYLDKYPVDSIKIDRSFVVRMLSHERTTAIVKSILQLGESLHVDIVAEGVETESQRQALTDMGCHLIQGFLLSRPMPADQIERYLVERRGVSGT